MKIKINTPTSLNEIGGRRNNEDHISPAKNESSTNDRLFLVCDGVGGMNKGEVASELVCLLFAQYFLNNPDQKIDKTYINNGLKEIENHFTKYIDENPENSGMASTLTMLYFDDNGATIGWCGDSRVYHIRNGKVLFQTEDHSLINELLKNGEITEEQAKTDKRKNRILRAIQGSENPTEIDIKKISNIQKDDFFFLCTDGILEVVNDSVINNLFSTGNTPETIKNNIQNLCLGKTRDNYSMYVVQIDSIEASKTQITTTKTNQQNETINLHSAP